KELRQLTSAFAGDPLAIPATRLLAWIYAAQGENELAMKTEETILTSHASLPDGPGLRSAYLNRAHILFNRKNYREAAAAYDDFVVRYGDAPERLLALYQSGICQLRLGHSGDAVDRWE